MSDLLRSTPTEEIVREINFQGGVKDYIKSLNRAGKKAPAQATICKWLKAQGYVLRRTYVLPAEVVQEGK